jgi:hypothetical protein
MNPLVVSWRSLVRASAAHPRISALVGAELAGVLGALVAIPVAGAIQVLIVDFLPARRGAGDRDSRDVVTAVSAGR